MCVKLNQFIHTVKPTKDETSETTVRNLYRLFSYINDYYKLVIFFARLLEVTEN